LFFGEEESELVSSENDYNVYKWTGDVKTNSGKTTCWLRAIDLANQTSEWSDPFSEDWIPPKPTIISITGNGVVVNIINNE